MGEKFFGLSVGVLQSLVDEYGCVIRRRDLVEVVTVEWLEKICDKKKFVCGAKWKFDLDENEEVITKEYHAIKIKDLLEAVRLRVKE